eukprot:UN23023
MTSETLIRVSYYGIFGRNQHSERLPSLFRAPFLHPFHSHTSYSDYDVFSILGIREIFCLRHKCELINLHSLLPPDHFQNPVNLFFSICLNVCLMRT